MAKKKKSSDIDFAVGSDDSQKKQPIEGEKKE